MLSPMTSHGSVGCVTPTSITRLVNSLASSRTTGTARVSFPSRGARRALCALRLL
jgi:hypothetical protein